MSSLRSLNAWSWLRIMTLCGVSWLVYMMLYTPPPS